MYQHKELESIHEKYPFLSLGAHAFIGCESPLAKAIMAPGKLHPNPFIHTRQVMYRTWHQRTKRTKVSEEGEPMQLPWS